jgi:hypothetical protein
MATSRHLFLLNESKGESLYITPCARVASASSFLLIPFPVPGAKGLQKWCTLSEQLEKDTV